MKVDNRTKKYLIWNTDFKEYVITRREGGEVDTTHCEVAEKGEALRRLDCVIAKWVEKRRLALRAASDGMVASRCYAIQPARLERRFTFEEDLELKGAMAEFVDLDLLKKVKQRILKKVPRI